MKKINLLVMAILTISLLIPGVMATSTFVTPGASAIISGSYMFNATSDLSGLTNCSITASSTLSGDSLTATLLYNSTATNANATIDTTGLEDATDYVFAGTCYNSSASSEVMTSRTGITVDNTVPVAPSAITPTSSDDKRDIAISSTVVGVNTTGCSMTVSTSQHSSSFTMDYSGDVCSDTITLPGGGDYTISITATDGTNASAAGTQEMKVSEKTGGNVGFISRSADVVTDDKSEKQAQFVKFLGIAALAYIFLGDKKGKTTTRRKRK